MDAHEAEATIRANVDAFYDKRISYDEFNTRQRAIWDAIDAAGGNVHHNVLALLRGDTSDIK